MITNEELLAPLKERLKEASDEIERIDILNEMGFALRFRDTKQAQMYAQDALQFSEVAEYLEGIARSSLTLGFCYLLLAQHDEAITFALKALYGFEELEDDLGKGRSRLLMGSVHWSLGNYDQALSHAMAGMKTLDTSDDAEFAGWGWNIMGGIHQSIGDIDQAAAYFDKAMTLFQSSNNTVGVARVMNGLALALDTIGSWEESLQYSREALLLHEEAGNALGKARSLNDMGLVYFHQGNLSEARRCHEEALQIRQDSNNPSSVITSLLNLGLVYSAEHNFDQATAILYTGLDMALSINAKPKVYELHLALSEAFEGAGDMRRAFEHYKQFHAIKEDVLNNETATRLRQLQTTLATEKAERENVLERKKNRELAEANAEIQRQMAILDEQATEIEIANAVLEEKNLVIAKMHEDSERLLLNVLPVPIAERLKQGAQTIADSFQNVTVLFADIVGFTQLSASTSPEELVQMLDAIFSDFDALAEKYGLEKIKTIGDCYMVVGGIPIPREDHALAVALMALEMRDAIDRFGKAIGSNIRVRIGLHTGDVVAGVIGKKKFAYDLWGDTVNTASRMESHGEAGKIHISEECFNLLKHRFTFEERGEIEVKGKGVMRTWFLTNSQFVQRSNTI